VSDTATKTITGKIAAVSKVNDFGFAGIKIESASGELWINSKVPGLIGTARNAVDTVKSVDYVEKEGKINQKTGEPYLNRYLEAIREPAQDEVNGNLDTTDFTGTFVTGQPTQDEFRRSKEEMRWTEALHIASRMGPTNVTQLEVFATEVEELIRAANIPVKTTPAVDNDIPF
jgi:hypothetical protein